MCEGEETQSSKEDAKELGAKYIMETFDPNLEEELDWKLKDVGEEMEEDIEPPTREHDKSPKCNEEVPLSEEHEEGIKHNEEVQT